MALRRFALAFAFVFALVPALLAPLGCKKLRGDGDSLEKLYCEGGVRDGRPAGGDCLDVTLATDAGDPSVIGRVALVSDYQVSYEVRRTGKKTFNLVRDGQVAGTLELDGSWVRVKLGDGRKVSLRSDMPGPLI